MPEGIKILIVQEAGSAAAALSLLIFLAVVHDIGKATPTFQSKPGFFSQGHIDSLLMDKLIGAGIPIKEYKSFNDADKFPHALAGEILLRSFGCDEGIASIIGSHHGKPSDRSVLKNNPNAYPDIYNMKGAGENAWVRLQQEALDYALRQANIDSVKDLPKVSQSSQVLLCGALIMIDWIASNENLFPYIPLDQHGSELDMEQRCICAEEKLALTKPWTPNDDFTKEGFCGLRFAFEANSLQNAVTKAALGCKTGGLMVVEAPMGVGKTEAALLAAEIYAKKAGRAGVFFALPTQATSDGIFPRFLDWIEKLDEFMTHSLRLAHGKAQFNDLYNELKKTDDSESFDSVQIDVDSQEDRSAIVHSWFEGNKKSMLADFVVGTVDQLLLMALKQRHLMLRHLGLAGKVVIVDECHAYDAYMSQYLQMALKWLGVYGVPVIVLSATLPLKKRKELVGAYLGMSEKHISRLDAPWGDNVSYPLITFTDGKDVNQIQADIDSTSLRRLEIKPLDSKDIEDKLEELLESGGCAGVIVNTVRRAQCFARRLKQRFGSENVLLVHSAFIAPDRIKRERRFLDQMGKKGIRKLKIVVGTQVLEQSLDFDVDVMITDLAPMDLLLQRMGRLQRHERKRPKRFSTATCYVMESQGELEDGAKAIYGEYLLARTKHYLPASIELPGDIPALVQSVYDEEIEICPEPSGYSEMKHEFQQMILGKQNRANDFRIQAETKRKSLHGWIDREASACGEKDSAQVRDSEPSVEVLVLQQAETGVRMLGGKEVFPQDQTPPSGHAREIARQILRLPGAVCRACFNKKEAIDELEDQSQRRLAAWQDSPWLKGELFLILDENMEASLNGYRLKYDAELGLQYEKEEE